MHEDPISEAEAASRDVRQGALVRFSLSVWLADATRPLTLAAKEQSADLEEPPSADAPPEERVQVVDGTFGDLAMVVSQSCDLARTDNSRQFVTLCPVYPVPPEAASEVRSGSHPRLLEVTWLPDQGDASLVADLSVLTTLERGLLVGLPILARTPEADRRRVAQALARYLGRPALPDAINWYLDRLTEHADERHDKDSPLGRFLQRIVQIRLTTDHPLDEDPPWRLHLIFIVREEHLLDSSPEAVNAANARRLGTDGIIALDRFLNEFDSDPSFGRADDLWRRAIDQWLSRLRPSPAVDGHPTFEVVSALPPHRYEQSDVLDLGYLSLAAGARDDA